MPISLIQTWQIMKPKLIGFRFRVLGSKVQSLIPSFHYPYGIDGIVKKREAINPER